MTEDADGRSLVRLHQLLLVVALAVPALLFGAAAWQNYQDVIREGQDSIERTAAVMQEHARKVLETAELAIGVLDERTDEMVRAQVADPSTSEFMRRLKAPMDQLVSLWIADGDGVILAGSQAWPPGRGIGGREFFETQRAHDAGTYIGRVFTGVATVTTSFPIVRRRTSPNGHFDGTIHAAANPEYFRRFYREIAPPMPHEAVLLRQDGAVLAHEPASALDQYGPDMPLMRRIAGWSGQGAMLYDRDANGVGQHYAIRKVGAYPLFVVFAVPHPVLLARWYENLRVYGMVAAGAAVTLLVVSFLALRRAQAEQGALKRLRAESTQRQAAEQQLRHAQRMDAVGQLTGGVAHDFNNLLTAILGNLELIQRAAGAGAEGRTKIERLTATAMKAVQRGAALTKSLLAFARKQPLQPRAIDANSALADVLDLVRQAAGVGIAVTFEPQPGLPACIADPAELEAAVLNLAINARDAMPDGGWLRLRTGLAELEAEALAENTEARPGRFVMIEVADGGSGMSPEVAAKAFEPFFTTKPIGQGTGLGLSQVFGFTRQLGGHVTIVSTQAGVSRKDGAECESGGRHGASGTAIALYLPTAA